ncbi:diguanylate cyclase (GGDEF)-like protein [Rubrivivax gelatinosus]|uniref:diguanylate cyclase n=1 Tax=Rubrivivax gelatinosus TaxID=28068 RepID=A0A4R2M3M5_RUBGE|nr:diguanylate cyclase (GGDEF)-like protein [Rubrivivax gelatinosus]
MRGRDALVRGPCAGWAALACSVWLGLGGVAASAEPRLPPEGHIGPEERALDEMLRAEVSLPPDERVARIDALLADPRWAAPAWQAMLAVEHCAVSQGASAAVLASLEARAGGSADPYLQAAALKCRQWVADHAGDPVDNYRYAREAWQLLARIQLPTLAFRIARDYADEATYAGALDEALTAVGRALEIARTAGDPLREADALTTLAMVQSDLGQHEDALRNSDRAFRLDPEISRSDDKLIARSSLQIAARQYDEASASLRRAMELAEREGDREAHLAARINLVDVYQKTHRVPQALQLSAEVVAEAERLGYEYLKAYAWVTRGFALAAAGQVPAGTEAFDRGRAWFEKGGQLGEVARALRDWARMMARAGRWEQAYRAAERADELRERTQREAREKNASFHAAVLESSRKDLDIERLRHQSQTAQLQLETERLNRRTTVVVAAAVLLSAASLLFVHLRTRRVNRQLRDANTALDYQSTHDPLTGAYNRRHFDRYFVRRQEAGGRVLLVLLDIDHFKAINDRHGHAGGDRALQETSRRLADCVRSEDCIVRWGGEEFLLVVDDPADAEAERALVLRLLEVLAGTPIEFGGVRKAVTASIGFASVELGAGFDLDRALADIDAMLYRAKAGGRHRAVGRFNGAGEPVVLLPPPAAVAGIAAA